MDACLVTACSLSNTAAYLALAWPMKANTLAVAENTMDAVQYHLTKVIRVGAHQRL